MIKIKERKIKEKNVGNYIIKKIMEIKNEMKGPDCNLLSIIIDYILFLIKKRLYSLA